MKLHFKVFELKLRHTFKIAHDQRDVQETLIVGLEHEGMMGYGEATANKYYGRPVAVMIDILENNRSFIEGATFDSLENFIETLAPKFSQNHFALCALDVAAHDLFGKLKGFKIHDYWGLDSTIITTTNYTIGIDSMDKMVEKLKAFEWPIYKIKLGTTQDVEIIKELRKHTRSTFRVDANCAWTVEQTIINSEALKQLGVEFIEQPLKANDWKGMGEVYKYSVLPLIADESCIEESDVNQCANYFHGINIKLMKCGGLLPALRMIANCRSKGMKIIVGCMTESSEGISAISQLLPLLDYVDIDGHLLITNDIGIGPKFSKGRIQLSEEMGTGVTIHSSWI